MPNALKNPSKFNEDKSLNSRRMIKHSAEISYLDPLSRMDSLF